MRGITAKPINQKAYSLLAYTLLLFSMFSCSNVSNQSLPTVAVLPSPQPTLTATRQAATSLPTLTPIPTGSRLDQELTAVYSDPTLIADLVESNSAEYNTVEEMNEFLDFALRLNAYGRIIRPIVEDGLAVANVENHFVTMTWDADNLSWFSTRYEYTIPGTNECAVDDYYQQAALVLCEIRDTGYQGSVEFQLEANMED